MSDRYYEPYEVLEKFAHDSYHVKMPDTTSGKGKKREGFVNAYHLRNAIDPQKAEGGKVFHPPGLGGRPKEDDPEGMDVEDE